MINTSWLTIRRSHKYCLQEVLPINVLVYAIEMFKEIMRQKQVLMKTIIICALVAAICTLFALLVGCENINIKSPEQVSALETASPRSAPDPVEQEKNAVVTETKTIGFFADTDDRNYSIMNEVLNICAAEDPECDWVIDYKVGNGTVIEQIRAVEDFIASGCDAIIAIQNNPNTTNTCIEMCVAADIPYFGAAHSFAGISNAGYAAGSTSYDLEYSGNLAGINALENGVDSVVIIEKTQNSANKQTLGFLKAFESAGMDFGKKADGTQWTAAEVAAKRPTPDGDDVSNPKVHGNYDVAVLYWGTCNGSVNQAETVMTEAVLLLEYDSWHGVYAQNNSIMEGVLRAMNDNQHTEHRHWLGSMNGHEISWDWAQDGKISMDVNQSSMLEAVLLYQMVKEYFMLGYVEKRYVHPYMTAYTKYTIKDLKDSLVPATDVNAFMEGMRAEKFVWRIADLKFTEISEYTYNR